MLNNWLSLILEYIEIPTYIATLFFLWRKDKKIFKKAVLAIILTSIVVLILKNIFKVRRPNNLESFSFPSGHTARVSSLIPFLPVFYIIVPFLVGISRIALGKHYLVDIIAGFYIGTFIGYLLKNIENTSIKEINRKIIHVSFLAIYVAISFLLSPPIFILFVFFSSILIGLILSVKSIRQFVFSIAGKNLKKDTYDVSSFFLSVLLCYILNYSKAPIFLGLFTMYDALACFAFKSKRKNIFTSFFLNLIFLIYFLRIKLSILISIILYAIYSILEYHSNELFKTDNILPFFYLLLFNALRM